MKLKKTSEVILNDGRTLEEVLRLHKKWLNGEEGGEKACLEGEYLSYVDLRNAILRGAILRGAILRGADSRGADLRGADLRGADLSYTDLRYADLNGVDLNDCIFYLTTLYKTKGDFVGVESIGSREDTTHYFYNDNRVICGCFDGTMEKFENEVKDTYKQDDKEYKQYMIAIRTLKELAEINKR